MVSQREWERTRWDRLQACCLCAAVAIVPTLPIVGWIMLHLRFSVV